MNDTTADEKRILLCEIERYIKENCYYRDGSIKHYDLWLVGRVAEKFTDHRNAMKVLINNKYGLLGNLLYKYVRSPDDSITQFIEQKDLEIMIEAIKGGGKDVFLRNDLYTDSYTMRLLLKHDEKYAEKVPGSLLKSKEFIMSVVDFYPEILKGVSKSIIDDEFAIELIKKNYISFKYLPKGFNSNYDICLKAVRCEGFSLMFFDMSIRSLDEIVFEAVSNRGSALSFASSEQKKNRRIVSAAVKSSGIALSYADTSLKGDFEIVSQAVKNHGMALGYASAELQDCEEIVRIAVANDGYAIRSASDRLRDNFELGVLAVSTYADAYNYLSFRLQTNPKIIDIYSSKKKEENKWLLSKMQ